MDSQAAGNAPAASEALASTSVFPPPPFIYRLFTKQNLAWFGVLKEHKGDVDWSTLDARGRLDAQNAILKSAVENVPDLKELVPPNVDLERELSPPRIDWIEQDGGYQLFGQRWPIPDVTPSLEELGIPRFFPESHELDRSKVLQTLLHTLLQTYFELVCDLLRPIQPYDVEVPMPHTEGQTTLISSSHLKDRLHHMETVVINFQYLLNQMRPLEARASLQSLLRHQLTERRQATERLRSKCAAVREEIQQLGM